MKKVLGFLLALVIGIGLTYTGYNEWQNSKKLVAEGKSTVAQVTDHYSQKSRRSSRKYYLVVAFETESQQAQKRTVRVSSDVYSAAQTSGTVQVHYLANDPSVVQAGPKAETKYASLVLGLLFLGCSLGTVAFYAGVALIHRGRGSKLSHAPAEINTLNQPPANDAQEQQKAA